MCVLIMLVAHILECFPNVPSTVSNFTGLANIILITMLRSRDFYRWKNTGTERARNLPKMSQKVAKLRGHTAAPEVTLSHASSLNDQKRDGGHIWRVQNWVCFKRAWVFWGATWPPCGLLTLSLTVKGQQLHNRPVALTKVGLWLEWG